jgi:IS1 family transposase
LQLLEIALMSPFNLKKAVDLELHHIIVNIILNTDSTEDSKLQAQICFSRMLTHKNLIGEMIEKPYFAHWMSTCIDNLPADVTLYTSAFKILQKAFESLAVTEVIFKNNHSLASNLIRITRKTKEFTKVLFENLQVKIPNFSDF